MELLETVWEMEDQNGAVIGQRHEEGELLAGENGLLYHLMDSYYFQNRVKHRTQQIIRNLQQC